MGLLMLAEPWMDHPNPAFPLSPFSGGRQALMGTRGRRIEGWKGTKEGKCYGGLSGIGENKRMVE